MNREISRSVEVDATADWETPAGPASSTAHRVAPAFVYRGYSDPHLRGQPCYVVGADTLEERKIVLACGCEARVPWWTLEPIA